MHFWQHLDVATLLLTAVSIGQVVFSGGPSIAELDIPVLSKIRFETRLVEPKEAQCVQFWYALDAAANGQERDLKGRPAIELAEPVLLLQARQFIKERNSCAKEGLMKYLEECAELIIKQKGLSVAELEKAKAAVLVEQTASEVVGAHNWPKAMKELETKYNIAKQEIERLLRRLESGKAEERKRQVEINEELGKQLEASKDELAKLKVELEQKENESNRLKENADSDKKALIKLEAKLNEALRDVSYGREERARCEFEIHDFKLKVAKLQKNEEMFKQEVQFQIDQVQKCRMTLDDEIFRAEFLQNKIKELEGKDGKDVGESSNRHVVFYSR